MNTGFLAVLTALCAAGIPIPGATAQTFPPAEKKQPPLSAAAPSGKTAPAAAAPFVAPKNEAEFIQSAVKCGILEVKIAQLALTKTDEAKVRDFAELVVKEHTTANDELKKVAGGFNIPLETADPKGNQKQEDLRQKAGKEFDEAFLEEMAAGHANDMALYEAGKKVCTSRGVTAFIDRTLPVVQRRAEKINLMGPGAHNPADNAPSPATPNAPAPGTKPVLTNRPTSFAICRGGSVRVHTACRNLSRFPGVSPGKGQASVWHDIRIMNQGTAS